MRLAGLLDRVSKTSMSAKLILAFLMIAVFVIANSLFNYFQLLKITDNIDFVSRVAITTGSKEAQNLETTLRLAEEDTRRSLVVALLFSAVAISLGISLARTLSSTISRMVTTLKIASLQSLDTAENIEDATKQISVSAKQIANGTQAQSEQVERTSRLVNELSTAIGQVAGAAHEAASTSRATSEVAQNSGVAAEESFGRLNTIKAIVTNASGMSQTLSAKSDQISEIVAIITQIAEQTNLLALNAAIEAARAGEAGRGFAVVADEVKKLADESGNSAKKIEEVVKDIQTQIKESNTSIAAGVGEVERSSEIIGEALNSLQRISTMSQEVSSKIEEISAAAQQQSAQSGQIASGVERIEESAEQNASGSEQISSSMQEQLFALGLLSDSSKQLVDLSEQLQLFVGVAPRALEVQKLNTGAKIYAKRK